jgi:hypothetical protein
MKKIGTYLACAAMICSSVPVRAEEGVSLRLFDDGSEPIMLCSPDGMDGGVNYADGRSVAWTSDTQGTMIKYFRDNKIALYTVDMTAAGTMQIDDSGTRDVTGSEIEKAARQDFAQLSMGCISKFRQLSRQAQVQKLVS